MWMDVENSYYFLAHDDYHILFWLKFKLFLKSVLFSLAVKLLNPKELI